MLSLGPNGWMAGRGGGIGRLADDWAAPKARAAQSSRVGLASSGRRLRVPAALISGVNSRRYISLNSGRGL